MKQRRKGKITAFIIFCAIGLLLAVTACQKQAPAPTPTPMPKKTVALADIRATLDAAETGAYEIYALKVGLAKRAKKKFFYAGVDKTVRTPISFCFNLLKGNGRVVLIDTGFTSQKRIKMWKIIDYRSPVSLLQSIGVELDQITDVVITHRHWDHIGGLPELSTPTLWIPKGEFRAAKKLFREKNPAIVAALKRFKKAGKVNFTPRVGEILPGVVVVRRGKHTGQFQFVVVKNADKTWILSSDVAPLYQNLHERHVSGQSVDRADSAQTIDDILALADGNLDHIVVSHDPEVFERYPQIQPGVVKITSP